MVALSTLAWVTGRIIRGSAPYSHNMRRLNFAASVPSDESSVGCRPVRGGPDASFFSFVRLSPSSLLMLVSGLFVMLCGLLVMVGCRSGHGRLL
jgi:hypothetical protein